MLLHRSLRRALPLALAAATLLTPALPAATADAATSTAWYLDCSATNDGSGSQAAPWNSLASANAHLFQPGDQLLLKRGATCTGTLRPQGSGTAGAPIILAGYGTGTARPVVAGDPASAASGSLCPSRSGVRCVLSACRTEALVLDVLGFSTGAARVRAGRRDGAKVA
ncbi:hypothetical protein [Kitasatospora sp. NPDC048407]|uniref:hypothetical protein n=1 Tax=Kitasatospora sp. NPDC048407 TaxID=3364051 RepID=UPI0037193D8B